MKRILLSFIIALFVAPSAYAKTYDKDYVGEMELYKAEYEDTLVHLARWHNLGFVEMMAANPDLDPWIPGEGAKVILPKQHILPDTKKKGIVINLPEMRLFYYPADGSAPEVHSIGVGREGLNTPLGVTSVTRKKEGPTWRPTARMKEEDPELKDVYPPGPDNPLGTHALYLGFPQYAIHGTNKPYGIGRRISSGCIRMYPESISDIYARVPVGTRVEIVDQPVKAGWIDDKMYVEVHPTQDQAIVVEKLEDLASYEMTAEDMKRILDKAGDYASYIDWENVREAVKQRAGYPIAVLDKTEKPGSRVQDDFQALLDEANTDAKTTQELTDQAQSKPEEVLKKVSDLIEEKEAVENGQTPKVEEATYEAEAGDENTPRASKPRTVQTWNN